MRIHTFNYSIYFVSFRNILRERERERERVRGGERGQKEGEGTKHVLCSRWCKMRTREEQRVHQTTVL